MPRSSQKNKIAIINHFDRSANGERALQIGQFLQSQNYQITYIDSQKIFEKHINSGKKFWQYPLEYSFFQIFQRLKYHFNINLKILDYLSHFFIRGRLIHNYLKTQKFCLAIFQNPDDIYALSFPYKYPLLYDSPTIFFMEKQSQLIKLIETKVYRNIDFLSFHWYSYFNLLRKLNICPKNKLILNWCYPPTNTIAHCSNNPKVVYLGAINDPWINPKLLIQLSKKHPIDVFSYQTPDPKLYPPGSINYRGYIKLENLSKYQFGLITITNEPLRNHGFSAKHIQYINYGLPVLCPEWRQDKLLLPSTISYNLSNFHDQIAKYSSPQRWHKIQKKSLKLAKSLRSKHNFSPLSGLIKQLKNLP